ncbi:hypothetical protein [Pseudomonas gessardii]|nr:hypothetical protein [Pseudomonas gessardii]
MSGQWRDSRSLPAFAPVTLLERLTRRVQVELRPTNAGPLSKQA